jgi:tripartite-type tricarboxylate transporter receptor subunit TctC
MLTATGKWSRLLIVMVLFIMVLFAGNGLCQSAYPNKPIMMVVQTNPGGTIDTLTRAISRIAEKELGQPLVIENKPGGANLIAVNYVVKSKPDGYTLGTTASLVLLNSPHMDNKMPFNVLTDLTDIMPFFKYTFGMCVRSDAPWNTFEELVDYARKNPGKVTYGNPGIGSTMHITMERIAMKEGIKWTAIPFKSDDESVLSCLGGHTNVVMSSSLLMSGHIKQGKLKLLLILDDTKWPEFPNAPTMLEKGFDFYAISFGAVYGPKGLPEPMRQRLEDVFRNAMKDKSYIEAIDRFQMQIPKFKGGKEYSDFWRSKYDEMGRTIKALGLGPK